jgi:hypothetical protein
MATSFSGSYTTDFFSYGDSLTITIPHRTRCILLHYDIHNTGQQEQQENNQHGGRKDNTIILTSGQLTISTTSGEAHV